MSSKICEFTVKFFCGFAVSRVGRFFCSMQPKRLMLSVGDDLGTPFFPACMPRYAFESRGILGTFSSVHAALRIVRRSYFFVVQDISSRMVDFSKWPASSFVQINQTMREIPTPVDVNVSVPVSHDAPSFFSDAIARSSVFLPFGRLFPEKLCSFFVVIKNGTNKFYGKIVFWERHVGLLLGGALS